MSNLLNKVKQFIAKTKVGAILFTSIKSLLSSEQVSKAVLDDTKLTVNSALDKILSCTSIDADVDIEVTGIKEVTITIKAKRIGGN